MIQQPDQTQQSGAGGDISLLALVNMHLRYRWLLILLPMFFVTVVASFSLTRPRTYSSWASFVPQTPQQQGLGGLAGVAAQFGVAVPGQKPGESPAFYAHLLHSPALLRPLVTADYEIGTAAVPGRGSLIRLFEIDDPDPALAEEKALEVLTRRLAVSRDRETGIVSVTARMETPHLAQHVVGRLFDLVNEFNLERRRSTATAEREFIEQRLAQAQQELRDEESRLGEFLRRNLQIGRSPELQFRLERLQQNVLMRQNVYASLAEAYEQARIDEVRNLAVITVVQQPTLPARPDGRRTVMKALVALILGFIVAWFLALVFELARRRGESEPDELREFEILRRQALDDLRRPLRGVGRVTTRSR
jgi:uncharacterized protein involved in exopolysaccharide biosynthesis